MSDALDRLWAEVTPTQSAHRIKHCNCGRALETSVFMQISDRESNTPLRSKRLRLCAECALAIFAQFEQLRPDGSGEAKAEDPTAAWVRHA